MKICVKPCTERKKQMERERRKKEDVYAKLKQSGWRKTLDKE